MHRKPPLLNPSPGLLEQINSVSAGRLRVREIVEALLDCVDRNEPDVRAWAHLDRNALIQLADLQDRERKAGRTSDQRLHGLVFAVKDNFDTCDMPTAYGSTIHAGCQPFRDASCVATLRMGGAALMGKTVTTEFAHVYPGATGNPFNPKHTPGGSSSGSAAAVAAAMVPFAFGTQTTGSVIRPAAYCGVVGFKPTFGDINVTGVLPNAPSFDTIGLFARSVADVAFVHGTLLGIDAESFDPLPVSGLKIGLCRTPWWDRADDIAHQSLESATEMLLSAGATITDFDPPGVFDDLEALSQTVSGFEFSRTLAHERRLAQSELSADLREGRMQSGLNTRYEVYADAQRRLRAARDRADQALEAIDLVISLPAPGPAPYGLRRTGDAIFNMPWTSLHMPALTLPAFSTDDGMPMGLQLSATRNSDRRLLAQAIGVADLFS